MRIAFLTPEYVTEQASFDGGLANYLYIVAQSLVLFGHEPHIFVLSTKNQFFTHAGVTVHRVRIGKTRYAHRMLDWWNRGKTPISLMWLNVSWHLNKVLRAAHAVTPFSIIQYSSYGATGYYRATNIPGVVRISSFEPLHRAARGITNPSGDELWVERLEMEAMHRADGVYGPGKYTVDAVSRAMGREVQLIESPFFLDTQNFDDSIYNRNLSGKQYLLYFGTIWTLKGVDVIAAILPKLFARHPDLHFVFVGKDFGSLNNVLTQAGKFHDRLIYFGKLLHNQLYPIIQNASGVVLPSLYDNFPNTCVEAMAFGRIVIGTKGTGFEQLIEDNKNGLLVEPNNPLELLDTIDKLLNLSPDKRSQLSKAALARISKLHPDLVVRQLLDFYESVVQQRQHRMYV